MKVKPGSLIIAVAAAVLSILYLAHLLHLRKEFGVVQVNSPRILSRKIYDRNDMHTEQLIIAEIALSKSSSKSIHISKKGHPDVPYIVDERYTNSMSPLQISYPAIPDAIPVQDKLERATVLSQHAIQTSEVQDAYTRKTRISQETTLMSYDVTTTTNPLNKSLSVSTATSIPFMGNYNCTDGLCSHFVLHGSSCRQSPLRFVTKKTGCHFMNGTNRAPVALVSFPGSGNTWVRGLLEQATGICTGKQVHVTYFFN